MGINQSDNEDMRFSICCLLLVLTSQGLLAQDTSRWRPTRAAHRALVRQASLRRDKLARQELSLEQLEQLALTKSPSLMIGSARVAATRGLQRQSGLYPNPVLGYMGMEMGNRASRVAFSGNGSSRETNCI